MAINTFKQGTFTFLHSNQIDALYTVLSSPQIKTAFDSQTAELKANYNNLIDNLLSITSDSGAKNIGVQTITDITGNDVQTVLQSLKNYMDNGFITVENGYTKAQVDAIAAAFVLGSLSPKSVVFSMLSDEQENKQRWGAI